MKQNIYNSLDEFIDEYAYGKSFSWQNDDKKQRFMGIDFSYKGIVYRMCREPGEDNEMPRLNEGKVGRYATYIMHNLMKNEKDDSQILLGWYCNLNDVLENWVIDGRKFKDVIMDENTTIEGQD